MKIKKIILKGYRRFSLKKIDEFVFEPKNKLTILNWKNGFGKSSLLAQLNPLPAELKKDFYPEGYKIIEFEHNGKEYSSISKDGKYSLIENGVELNPGGTKKVQLELVQNIFGLNQHILNVINGNTRFTEMSPSERKQWLTKISTVDFEYSLKIYSKILTRKSDLSSWIKLTSEKIIECNKVLSSYEDLDKLKEEEKFILDTIESFLKEYQHEDNFKNEEDVFNRLEELMRIKNRFDYSVLKNNKEDILKNINILEDRNKNIEKEREKLYEEYKKINETIDEDTVKDVIKENEELEKQLWMLPKEITLDNISSASDEVYRMKSKLYLMGMKLKEFNYDKEVMSLSYLEDLLKSKIREISVLDAKIKMIKEKLEGFTLGKIEKIRCPSCSSDINIKNILEHREEEMTKLQDELNKKSKEYREIEYDINYAKLFNNLKEYYLTIAENNLISKYFEKEKPFSLNHCLNVAEDLDVFYNLLKNNYYKLLYKKKQNDEIIYKAKVMETMNKEMKNKQKELLELNVKRLTDDFNNNMKLKEQYLNELKCIEDLSSIRERVIENLKEINVLKEEDVLRHKNNFIKEVVTTLKEKSIVVKNKLESYNSMKKNNEEYNKELEKYKNEIKLVELLLKALSPTNGLIAKSINSFLGVVIDEMNAIINSIWNYKITILPCDLEEGVDLTYRFKVRVNDDHNFIIEDVSKLSSSMKEIVDLSFRLVFIKYINLGSLPIMLDEFGRTMDSEHRINAFNMVDEIIVNSFDQVFLVSHFEEMYGRFKNADYPEIEKK